MLKETLHVDVSLSLREACFFGDIAGDRSGVLLLARPWTWDNSITGVVGIRQPIVGIHIT